MIRDLDRAELVRIGVRLACLTAFAAYAYWKVSPPPEYNHTPQTIPSTETGVRTNEERIAREKVLFGPTPTSTVQLQGENLERNSLLVLPTLKEDR